ncbi:hypothetical protein [Schaalia sp. lx-260]|uniref:hypothetical protein n=1 Tax=Schaalia sp. lx-260 TaxID=2899082 RepID=UPI001E415C54|nr:hypothetical protein [Schaalia sp. lx-260]MCD4548874.1 hypothetical protein [Schaalia sp. lx-260]
MTEDEKPQSLGPAPRRRSVFEGLAQLPVTSLAPTENTHTHLTDTSVAFLGKASENNHAFRVDETGTFTQSHIIPIPQYATRTRPIRDIDHYTATGHHFLAVNDDIDDNEIEALIVSLWEGAGWASPGILHITAGVRMEGPWNLPEDLREKFCIPDEQTKIWLLVCPPTRGPALKNIDNTPDMWAQAFPNGLPQGVEAKVLRTLMNVARRLAGTVRIAGSGALFTPDPDSAVTLALYAPRWLNPQESIEALRSQFPQAHDARTVNIAQPAPSLSSESQRLKNMMTTAYPLKPEIRAKIEADIRQAAAGPPTLDAYAVMIPVGNMSHAMIEVRPTHTVPQALRWERWADGPVVEYRIRWIPDEKTRSMYATAAGEQTLSRTARFERKRSAADIEKAAALLNLMVGGTILDEDGFIVAIENAPDDDTAGGPTQ